VCLKENSYFTPENRNISRKKHYSAVEAQRLLEQYRAYYDNKRFQKKLGQLSPVECREKLAA